MTERAKITCDPDQPTIEIERWFAAPAARVYEASTKPELLRKWWGPCTGTMTTCEVDLRVGGKWRFELTFADGTKHGFHGEYREIDPARRIVQTFIYDPFPDAVAVETVSFIEEAGRTKLHILLRHASMQARDGHIASGMERGMAETHEKLDALLAA